MAEQHLSDFFLAHPSGSFKLDGKAYNKDTTQGMVEWEEDFDLIFSEKLTETLPRTTALHYQQLGLNTEVRNGSPGTVHVKKDRRLIAIVTIVQIPNQGRATINVKAFS